MRLSLGWILGLCTLLIGSANAQVITSPNDVKVKSSNASIKFETTSHSFGNIIEGQIARYDFKFVNTGTEPLILSAVPFVTTFSSIVLILYSVSLEQRGFLSFT